MNKVSVKYFVIGEEPVVEYNQIIDNPEDVLNTAYEVAFDMVGFGLASWDFVDRSYNKGTKQLTEIYRYNVDTTSHYQLCIKKQL